MASATCTPCCSRRARPCCDGCGWMFLSRDPFSVANRHVAGRAGPGRLQRRGRERAQHLRVDGAQRPPQEAPLERGQPCGQLLRRRRVRERCGCTSRRSDVFVHKTTAGLSNQQLSCAVSNFCVHSIASTLVDSMSSGSRSNGPVTYRPRLLIAGSPGQGQTSHVAPALLHAMERLPVHVLDLPALYAVSVKTAEESCADVSGVFGFLATSLVISRADIGLPLYLCPVDAQIVTSYPHFLPTLKVQLGNCPSGTLSNLDTTSEMNCCTDVYGAADSPLESLA